MEHDIELIENILKETGLASFPAVWDLDKIRRAIVTYAERIDAERNATGKTAMRLLEKVRGPFERWDDRSQADFVEVMASEVIPFLSSERAKQFILRVA